MRVAVYARVSTEHEAHIGHTWYKLGVSEADIMIYYTLG